MRAPRTLLVVLVTALLGALAVAFAPPSSAGGPTSVLLVDTATGRASALYTTDPRYEKLSDLMDAMAPASSDGSSPAPGVGTWTPGSGGITVTWLMHDVLVWRVDHVFVDGGTVAIGSASDMAGLTTFDQKPAWHRPHDPAALTSLLGSLGLGPRAAATQQAAPAAASAPGRSAAANAAPRPSSATTSASVPAAWWGLAGLVVGAGLALVAGRLRRRARPAPPDDDGAEVPPSAEVLHG